MAKRKTVELRGRNLSLDPDIVAEVTRLLGVGNYEKYVYQALGIPRGTWDLWKARGLDYRERYDAGEVLQFTSMKRAKECRLLMDFSDAIKKGKAGAINRNLSIVQAAALEHWQAAAWYLERVAPQEFGRKDRLDLYRTDEAGQYDDMTDEEVESEIESLDRILLDARSNPAGKN